MDLLGVHTSVYKTVYRNMKELLSFLLNSQQLVQGHYTDLLPVMTH